MADPRQMEPKWRTFLALYLGASAILAGYLVYSLWAPAPIEHVLASPQCSKVLIPSVQGVFPASLSVGTATKVVFWGCLFPSDTQIQVNGSPHNSAFADPSHIEADLSAADLTTVGALTVTFWHEKQGIGWWVLNVRSPSFHWKVLGLSPWEVSQEVQLLLLAIFMGSMASSVYASKSLADFAGDQKLTDDWFSFI